jgi:DedD protein
MARQQAEDELNLRRKARRRLIGAVALTLAVVVILPMVLDSEPKTSGNDINLTIPDPDKAGAFVTRVPAPEVPQPASGSTLEIGSTQPAPPADSAKAAVTPVQAKTEPAEKTTPAKQKSAQQPTGSESYVVQIGAYANAGTAKQQYNNLKKWGFRVYTEKVDGNTRVRVGPYTNRDKAEKAKGLLEKHGLHPEIFSNK